MFSRNLKDRFYVCRVYISRLSFQRHSCRLWINKTNRFDATSSDSQKETQTYTSVLLKQKDQHHYKILYLVFKYVATCVSWKGFYVCVFSKAGGSSRQHCDAVSTAACCSPCVPIQWRTSCYTTDTEIQTLRVGEWI